MILQINCVRCLLTANNNKKKIFHPKDRKERKEPSSKGVRRLLPHSVAAHGLLMGFLSLKCIRSQTLPWNFEANRSALPPIYGERKVHREKGALCPSHMDRPRSRVAGTRLHAKIKMRSPRGFLQQTSQLMPPTHQEYHQTEVATLCRKQI